MEILYDIRQTILLNKKELLTMTKEYLLVYMKSLLFNLYGSKKRKQLMECLKKYYYGIQLENLYLETIINHIDFVDIEKVEIYMNKLDILNEKTYHYHESILAVLEEQIFENDDLEIKLPYKDFKTITEDNDYHLELLNVFVSSTKVELSQEQDKINKILRKNQKEV